MRAPDTPALPPVATLVARLAQPSSAPAPLLVVRVPELERTAWRAGLRKARSLERRVSIAFADAARRVLRADDAVAHDPGSDVFLAALTAPTRDASGDNAIDARSALARICASVERDVELHLEPGWTICVTGESASPAALIERALRRGAQERERYAFFSALGHELRTPLASIRGYLETLLDDSIDAPNRERFLLIAYNESLRLGRLIDGMFEISLLDLQPARSSRTSGELDVALAAAVDACVANADRRKLALRFPAPPRVDVPIETDRLTLVLINVIDNAIKHGRARGCVEIGVVNENASVVVTIDDDGPGIARADRDRIFALGERGITAAHGTGIGLAFVRLMLERAGGRVDITDSPLGGARFRIVLPHLAVNAARA